MKLKKCLWSLLVLMIVSASSLTSVYGASYDTNKIIEAANKVKDFYQEASIPTGSLLDHIIAYEALGGEAEDDLNVEGFESYAANNIGYVGGLSKVIITAKLLGLDPTAIELNGTVQNLVTMLEGYVDNEGCFGSQVGNNNEIWGILALEAVSSTQVERVADHIASDINEDGGFWNFGYDGNWQIDYNLHVSSLDVTGWGIEALTVAQEVTGKSYQATIDKALSYIKGLQQDGAFYDAANFGTPNTDSQACVIEGLSVYNRDNLINGTYDQNGINPVDVMLQFQNEEGWFIYSHDDWVDVTTVDYFATQDAARALGTIINGSVLYKILDVDYPVLQPTSNNPIENNQQPAPQPEEVKSVKTGDDNMIAVMISLTLLSAGCFVAIKYRYE